MRASIVSMLLLFAGNQACFANNTLVTTLMDLTVPPYESHEAYFGFRTALEVTVRSYYNCGRRQEERILPSQNREYQIGRFVGLTNGLVLIRTELDRWRSRECGTGWFYIISEVPYHQIATIRVETPLREDHRYHGLSPQSVYP